MSRRARKRASVVAAQWVGFAPVDPLEDDDDEGSTPDLQQWGDDVVELASHSHPQSVEPGAQA